MSMTLRVALAAALTLLAQSAVAAAPSTRTLACDIPAPGGASATTARIFQFGPGSLREWDSAKKVFGPNRCESFACNKIPGRTEAAISSASLAYTVGVDDATGKGYWRVAGASGASPKQGACRVIPNGPYR